MKLTILLLLIFTVHTGISQGLVIISSSTNGSATTPPVDTGADYYVGGFGAIDLNPGTWLQPFASIGAAALVADDDDIVEIRSGTYRETITPANSGTFGHTITYRAAEGATVIISGLEVVPNAGWIQESGNIYRKTVALPINGFDSDGISSTTDILANQIFKDGDMMIEARWPDGVKSKDNLFDMTASSNLSTSAWRHFSDFGTGGTILNTTLQDNQILASNGFPIPSGQLVGKTIIVQGWFFTGSATITAHSGNSLTWSPAMWANNSNDEHFRKYYYLTGDVRFLNQEREFFYNGSNLYFWQPGGGTPSGTIEFKARNWGFNLSNRSYITLEGLTFIGCEPTYGNASTANCTIDNIRASFLNHHVTHPIYVFQGHGMSQYMGTQFYGQNNTIKNSELQWASSQGIWIGTNGIINNNKIHHIGYDGMWGAPVSFGGPDMAGTNNIKVTNNTIYTTGRSAIDNGYAFVEGQVKNVTNNEIAYNDISDFNKLNQDGGAFYSWGYQNLSGNRIHHNYFHDMISFRPPNGDLTDGIMAAIYIDMGSGATVGQSPLAVDHNVFSNIGETSGFTLTEVADIYEKLAHSYSTKQGTLYYNNTMWGHQRGYHCGEGTVASILRNNISRSQIMFNFYPSLSTDACDIDYTTIQANQSIGSFPPPGKGANTLVNTNPLLNGGSLSNPYVYFGLQSGSSAVNSGTVIAPYTDGSVGTPDRGAFERGLTPWTAGYVPID